MVFPPGSKPSKFLALPAACKALTATWDARQKGMALERVEVQVERDDSQERQGKYLLTVHLPFHGALTEEDRSPLGTPGRHGQGGTPRRRREVGTGYRRRRLCGGRGTSRGSILRGIAVQPIVTTLKGRTAGRRLDLVNLWLPRSTKGTGRCPTST
jgi:hypothetical protein